MGRQIDFTNEKINKLRLYGGSQGNKIGVKYQGENYMLKFPPKPGRKPDVSYTNGCVSEYVACHVFESLGINTQKTLLGRHGDKIIVACKDFETDGFILKDFAQLKNSVINSSQSGYGTELIDVLASIKEQQIISPVELETFFWRMFVGDALLGNFDRHNGNWGFLINESSGEVNIAPIFDCGSCLYPQLDEPGMRHVLDNQEEIDARIFAFPNSALKQDGVKINYAQFLKSPGYKACHEAMIDIGGRIDLIKINGIVDNTPYISDIHKAFLKTMLKERKEKIIDQALERTAKPAAPYGQ